MLENQPSRTALHVAMARAAHQLFDRPPVFDDPLALRILGPQRAHFLRALPRTTGRFGTHHLRAFLAARARVAEDALADAVAAGVRQYVVLGAGLDTFAYRSPWGAEELHVFEVDHPSTQAWKRRQLSDVGITIPAALSYVPVDFAHQSLERELLAAGLEPERGAFFAWLGVTPYLELEAVSATLDAVGRMCEPGGGVVFDYAVPPESLTLPRRVALGWVAAGVRSVGEPWRSFLDPATLVAAMSARGFSEVEDLSGAVLNERYFEDRRDRLRVGEIGRVLRAWRPPTRAGGRRAPKRRGAASLRSRSAPTARAG